MKKVVALFFGLITLLPFIFIGWLLYKAYPSTPVAILNLLIIMTGVMIAFTVYLKAVKRATSDQESLTADFPPLELGLKPVSPAEFCKNYESKQGNLYFILEEEVENIQLLKAEYDKLRDELHLKFDQGITLTFRSVLFLHVGDHQFAIKHVDEFSMKNKQGTHRFEKYRNEITVLTSIEKEAVKISKQEAVCVFEWEKLDHK